MRARSFLATRHPGLGEPGSLGIRPEAIRLSSRGAPMPESSFAGAAEVTGILPTGGNWIVELTAAGTRLFLTTGKVPEARVGDSVGYAVDPESLHVFDTAGHRSEAADRLLRPAQLHA